MKTIVFSQFTKFLDIIQCHLQKNGFKFVRLDGTMNIRQRDAALDTFSSSAAHTIMLASLSVGSVGVCLVKMGLTTAKLDCCKSSYLGG